MKPKESPRRLDDVLYEFSLASAVPDAAVLDEFARKYPEYAEVLTDLAVDIALDTLRGDKEPAPIEAAMSPAVSRAMARFSNQLFAVRQSQGRLTRASTSSVQNPFTGLSRSDIRSFTEGLHCNTVFALMLRDQQIDPATITKGFVGAVASELHAPIELVAAHFASQAQAMAPQLFKADHKPQQGLQISFERAVKESGLTEEQQKYLLSL
jgi:hypothetical protein